MSDLSNDQQSVEREQLGRYLPWVFGLPAAAWLAWLSWKLTWMVALYGDVWTPSAVAWGSLTILVSVLWLQIHRGKPIGRVGPICIAAHFFLAMVALVAGRGSLPVMLALIIVGLVVYLPLNVALTMHRPDEKSLKLLLSVICAALVLPALFLVIWSPISALIVATRASATAGDAPYCLQRPHHPQDQEVARWRELTGFNLQAPWYIGSGSDEYQYGFHAVLVVARNGVSQFYNWSYYQQAFLPISDRGRRSLYLYQDCKPKARFTEGMPL